MLTDPQEHTVRNLPEKAEINIHNITCPRCRFKIENAAEGDIRTKLCDHCLHNLEKADKHKCKLLQKKVKKPSNVHSDIELSSDILKFKQRLVTRKTSKPDFPPTKISPLFDLSKAIQRPPKSDAGPSHIKKYLRPIISKTDKSESDFSEIESENQQITTKKSKNYVAFPSDDSVVTSFLTSFDDKIPSQNFRYVFAGDELKRTSSQNFKYVFPGDELKRTSLKKNKSIHKSSSELITETVKKKLAAKLELEKKSVQKIKAELEIKPIQEEKPAEKPKKKTLAKPKLTKQPVKLVNPYPILKVASCKEPVLKVTGDQDPVEYKQEKIELAKPGQEKILPKKPELEKKPVQEKKLEPETKPVQEKKSEQEIKPAQEKKPEPDKKSVQEKKSELKKKPTQEKKPEPEKKPVQEKKLEPEKKPVQEKKSEPEKKPAQEKKPEPEKKPVQEKKPETEKKSQQVKKPVQEKTPIQEKKPAQVTVKTGQENQATAKPEQEKKLSAKADSFEPEKKPVQENKPDSEKKPAQEKKSKPDEKSRNEKKTKPESEQNLTKTKKTKKEPAKSGKENKLPEEGKVTPGKIVQEVVTPEARKFDKITETNKPSKEEPKIQEDLVLAKMLRHQTSKSKDIEREKRALEFKNLFMHKPASTQSQKQTKPQRTGKKQNIRSAHQKIKKSDVKEIAKENKFTQKQMSQAELIFGKDIILKKSIIRSPSFQPGPNELFRTKFNADIHTYADVSESPKTTGGRGLGITSYALSNPKYIKNGWTVLPQQKCIQKVNIYGMRPSQPEFDWFKHNKHRGVIYHEDTCEKMAEIDDNGCGRWYYNNGQLALDYYECEEEYVRKRFVVYSKSETGSRDGKTGSVLAMFDYQGNGIVYDEHGDIRIKYTQSEGVVMDRTIGPYCTWKWHNLNDPPVLQAIVSDNLSPYPDPYISSLDPDDVKIREDDEEMLAIEFTNFIKERSKKMKQKYQQYPIRTKALKINDQFALKILDQEHIYLKFMEGSTNIKINIGVTLNPNEILQSDVTDVGIVTNRLERRPARSRSLYDLQTNIKQFRRHQRHLDDHAKRIRPTVPVLSADKLLVGVSKPLRLPILPVKSETKSYKDEHPTLFEMCYDNPGVLVK